MSNIPWWGYVVLAGLAWGTYVPLIFFGGQMLSPLNPQGVAVPVALMATRTDAKPDWRTVGLVFSGLAGAAGAVGAICVVFASKAAVDTAKAEGVNPATYRVYIAPFIFCLAPLINTLVSLVWHPNAKTGEWSAFHLDLPGWKLWAGVVLVAAGTFLVLKSKEEAEVSHAKPPAPAPVTPAPADGSTPAAAP